ncbi:hypothetical protein G9A89_002549 [Geosiphon pyriformis]|nr:hypothetical protein G9A89_002549 [Geosiphon pyriformis]
MCSYFAVKVNSSTGILSVDYPNDSSAGVGPLDVCGSDNFVSICNRLSQVGTNSLSVYTDDSLKNLGMVGYRAKAAVFFENINLDLGVSVHGLLSSTLMELQAIALALKCMPAVHSVYLFSDSQTALDACRSESDLDSLVKDPEIQVEFYILSDSLPEGHDCQNKSGHQAKKKIRHNCDSRKTTTITTESLSIIQRTPQQNLQINQNFRYSIFRTASMEVAFEHQVMGTPVNTESARETFYKELIQNTNLPTNHNFASIITEINKEIEHHTQQRYPITYASKGKGKLQTPVVTPRKIQPPA